MLNHCGCATKSLWRHKLQSFQESKVCLISASTAQLLMQQLSVVKKSGLTSKQQTIIAWIFHPCYFCCCLTKVLTKWHKLRTSICHTDDHQQSEWKKAFIKQTKILFGFARKNQAYTLEISIFWLVWWRSLIIHIFHSIEGVFKIFFL